MSEHAQEAPVRERGSVLALAGPRIVALALGVASVAWAAIGLAASGWAPLALAVAVASVAAGSLRLALLEVPEPQEAYFMGLAERTWYQFLSVIRTLPWEEAGCAAMLWLEVLHPARAWHTAVLGAALAGWLLAVHIAESGTGAVALLRRQARVLVLGLCLLALGAAASLLPAASSGGGAVALQILAVIAVTAAAILVLPG
ncbi:MAG TPA: hypothetical protein VMG38_19115 [Trebonia sp.]|nr:hypothetical protein [Trebonia sp.]